MKTKVVRDVELSFVVRPMVYVDEIDVRMLVAYLQGRAVGFGVFDPIYRDGKIIGYLANTLRVAGGFHYSVQDCIILEGIRLFKEEGKEILSLGWSPLAEIDDAGEFRYSKFLKAVFKFAYAHANFLYAFKTVTFHKSRYRPGSDGCWEQKVYCACRSPVRIPVLYKVFSLMGVDPVRQVISSIRSAYRRRT